MRIYRNTAPSLPSSRYLLAMPSMKQISTRPSLQTRAQGGRDDGKSGNEANMSILRERIEEVRMKERLERCFTGKNGWNYASGYHSKHSMDTSKFFEISRMVFGTFGLTIGTGALCLYLFSLLAHLCQ